MQFADLTSKLPTLPKKRKTSKEPSGTMALVLHDSLDQPSVPGTELGKLGQRVHQLEKIVSDHDQQLRTLDAWSTVGWLLSKDDPLGTTLLTRLQDWNTNRPASGPHP